MKWNMKRIADEAGVSAATVSRVINGNENVTPEKRERVMKVISGNQITDHLSKHKDNRIKHIGFLCLAGTEFDIFAVWRKVMAAAEALPYKMMLQIYPPNVTAMMLESQYLRKQLSGLLICGHTVDNPRILQLLERVPHVWLNSYQIHDQEPVVLMGNEFAGKIAVNYLVEHKCKRLGMLALQNDNPGLHTRLTGFRVHCFLKKIPCIEIPVVFPPLHSGFGSILSDMAEIEKRIEMALRALPRDSFPDGIFSPEEKFTPLLYRALQRVRGKKMPLLISCNHNPDCLAGLPVRPASIDLHPELVARLAVEELIGRINGNQGTPDNVAVVIRPELIPPLN